MTDNKKQIRGKWSEECMIMAVSKVMSMEMTAREAAKVFSVPRSTLGDRIRALKEGNSVALTPRCAEWTWHSQDLPVLDFGL